MELVERKPGRPRGTQTIAANLRAHVKRLLGTRKTYTAIAAETGISRQTIAKWARQWRDAS